MKRKVTYEEQQEILLNILQKTHEYCEKNGLRYCLAYGTLIGAVRHKGFIPWDTDADVCILLPDKEKFREAFAKHKPEGIKLKNHNLEKRCLQSHDTLIFEDKMEVGDLHLDIFPLVGAPSDVKEQKKFARYSKYADKIIRSKYVDIRLCKRKNKFFVFLVKIFDFFIPNKILRKNIYKREHKYDYDKAEFLITLSNYGNANSCIPKDILLKTVKQPFNDSEFEIPANYDMYLRRIYGDDYMTPKKY